MVGGDLLECAQMQPQFYGGGPTVVVRNTFIDFDPQTPMYVARCKTAPAEVLMGESSSVKVGDTCAATETSPEGPQEGGEELAWPQERVPAVSPSLREQKPSRQPQTVRSAYSTNSGVHRIFWNVDARKLRGNDKQAVSPAFELPFASIPFKMMIHPRSGTANFNSSRGNGFIQLKCEDELLEGDAKVSFRFFIGSGEKMQPPRGPVLHDFAQNSICGLPKGQDVWDFSKAVDRDSMTTVVCLEIMPRSLSGSEF